MNPSSIVAIALTLGSASLLQAQPAVLAESTLPMGAEPKPVGPAKFKSEYALIAMPQTMHVVTYLGRRAGRAYLNHRSMSLLDKKKWSDHVMVVELAELDEAFRDSLPKKELQDAK